MKRIFSNLKYIKLNDFIAILIFIFMIIPSLLFKLFNKIRNIKIMLICENGQTARDNGYHFYKYVRINHPDEYCYYVIDKKSEGYNSVKKYGNIIQYKSLKHWLYYLSATYNISSQKDGNPNAPLFYFFHVVLGLYNNRIFLQHGITKDNAKWLYYKNCKFKYFICGAKDEYNFIKNYFGYPKENVLYTGFARFDNLYNNQINKKQILIMPTWRQWLGRKTNSLGEKFIFENTPFFKNWNNLLNDEKFIDFVEQNKIEIIFYPHMNMQQFLKSFSVNSKNIKIASMKTDIQKVLKESSILITDYSSVFMDFAYMLKPIIFYQFDYDEYREKQYDEGYYDYKNGFGPSLKNKNELINEIIKIYNNGLEKKYIDRMKSFFEIRDKNNCKRIYDEITKK